MLRRIFAMRSLSRATRHDQTNRHRRTWSAKSSTSLDDHNHRVQHWRKSDAAEMTIAGSLRCRIMRCRIVNRTPTPSAPDRSATARPPWPARSTHVPAKRSYQASWRRETASHACNMTISDRAIECDRKPSYSAGIGDRLGPHHHRDRGDQEWREHDGQEAITAPRCCRHWRRSPVSGIGCCYKMPQPIAHGSAELPCASIQLVSSQRAPKLVLPNSSLNWLGCARQ
jgi:hypothetical protein